MLDELHPVLGEAWAAIAARAVSQEGLDVSVLHWDTTSVYFEGEHEESDLAEYGHSSEGFSDKKQFKLGLDVTNRERVPLLYRVLSGSTADNTTPVPNLQAITAFLQRPECASLAVRPMVVGDCKMITPAGVAAAHENHLYYLGPWEVDQQVEAVLRSVSQTELESHPLDYRPSRGFPAQQPFVPYCGKWQPFPVTYQDVTYQDRALIVWSAGKQRLDEEKRKLYLKRLLNRCAEIKAHLNQGRYIRHEYTAHQIALAQRGNPAKRLVSVELTGTDRELGLTFHIDRPALARAQTLDGRYLLGTNADLLSADQALNIFKAQDRVEKSHAQIKGPLRIRPVFLHSDERIEGLVFVTLLALLVNRLLELHARRAGLRISAQRMLQTFTSCYATHLIFVDGSQYQQLGKMTPSQEKILDKLLFPSPTRYLEPFPD